MAGVVLRLVVHPHVICDVSGGQELATDVAGDFLLMANHVRTQTILRGKAGLTGRTFEGPLRGVHLSDVTVEMVGPGESLATVGADVGFFHTTLVGAHVVAHAVLPLEALLADGAGERLLVRVGQPVAVEMVHVAESLPACLAGVILPDRVWVGIRRPPSVDRLVPPQVVVVLELLVADGTDVGYAGRPRHWLHGQGFLTEGSSVHS